MASSSSSSSSSSSIFIPVINMNSHSEMLMAAQEIGCFRLTGFHQVLSPTLMGQMKQVVMGLFDRPISVKRRNENVYVASGYMEPDSTNPIYEAFGFLDARVPGAVDIFCQQLDVFEEDRNTILNYTRAIHQIQMSITHSLSTSLGVNLDTTELQEWPYHIKINKYHFSPDTIGTVGVQLHTDSSFLTVLQDDESVGGLEIQDLNNNFVSVEPRDGTLLVNLGDMATVWSNGRLKNVRHHVLCKNSEVRFSMASFLLGPTGNVEPRPELVDIEHPRRYKSTTFKGNRARRFKIKKQAGETIEELRL